MLTSTQKLPSKYQIGENVSVVVSEEHQWEGEVVAVRFTRAKVLYDVLDRDVEGVIIKDIDSACCKQPKL